MSQPASSPTAGQAAVAPVGALVPAGLRPAGVEPREPAGGAADARIGERGDEGGKATGREPGLRIGQDDDVAGRDPEDRVLRRGLTAPIEVEDDDPRVERRKCVRDPHRVVRRAVGGDHDLQLERHLLGEDVGDPRCDRAPS